MIVTLQTHGLQTLDQVRALLEGNEGLEFERPEHKASCEFISQTLKRFEYARLGRAEKGLVRRYLSKLGGLSRAQVSRLIARFRTTGRISYAEASLTWDIIARFDAV